jgi:hypothetical protein
MADAPSPQFEAKAAEIPEHITLLFTNVDDPLEQVIFLPQDGTLWVGYEVSDSGTVAQIRHQDGSTETIEPGFENKFTVKEFDAIAIQLAAPDQQIRLGWKFL